MIDKIENIFKQVTRYMLIAIKVFCSITIYICIMRLFLLLIGQGFFGFKVIDQDVSNISSLMGFSLILGLACILVDMICDLRDGNLR